jgi:long-subunit fatty acid transport protein
MMADSTISADLNYKDTYHAGIGIYYRIEDFLTRVV